MELLKPCSISERNEKLCSNSCFCRISLKAINVKIQKLRIQSVSRRRKSVGSNFLTLKDFCENEKKSLDSLFLVFSVRMTWAVHGGFRFQTTAGAIIKA